MNYRIAICDDDPSDLEYVRQLVSDWCAASGHTAEMDAFPSAEAFLFRYAGSKAYDILLLDIEMGGLNGIEMAKELRRDNDAIQIIFITGYPDFIAEGYEVAALHYLRKPVSGGKLGQVLDRAAKNIGREKKTVYLPLDGERVRVVLDEIQYIQVFDHLTEVVTARETYSLKLPLRELEGLLTGAFVRLHRGCIVNLGCVKKITRTDVVLDSGKSLPVSRRMYAEVNRAMIKYMTGGMER